MCVSRNVAWLLLLLAFAFPSFSQSAQEAPPADQSAAPASDQSSPPQPLPPGAHSAHRQVPCWKEAGISPAMVNERWKIEDAAKTRISGVCSDQSLTAQQRTEKIHQIDEQQDRQIEKIIPADKLSAFKACQAQRDMQQSMRAGKTPARQLGPCGGVIPPQASPAEHSH